ncbi:HET-domain-containing protein [Glonium stellatum]|uniref:HET-domain-containing protein n=1 Tax=Glonium stellatum TaxID=574774 RepID=A0A8E2FDQ2_9PEZI|nr:HET-domain-containing protein [Glonium stellatum]
MTIEVAKGWLKQCLEEHEPCRKKAHLASIWAHGSIHIVRDLDYDDRMPRRLLVVDADSVKLVEIGKTTEKTEYFALSHRWGPQETFKTTETTISDFKNGFPISVLPRTFRDALEVTRACGYRHLWIDSLCIIQDNPDDWKEESPRMAVVYGNAVCTIMATDAEDSDGGLFCHSASDQSGRHSSGALNSRAWVVQERMISSRTLAYTNNSVDWECREYDATQNEPRLVKRLLQDDREALPTHPKELFSLLRDFRINGEIKDSESELHEFADFEDGLIGERDSYNPFLKVWWQFLELYTPCSLSHEADKFLAMNGIAAITQRHTRLRNTWGLWRNFLEHELLWSIDPQGPPSSRPKRWRAPFWSWASTENGKVINNYYKRLPVLPRLMIKPEIQVPVNTSFDERLPILAWTPMNYSMVLKGDLRTANLIVTLDEAKNRIYAIELESTGRWSESEEHEFRPDTPMQICSSSVQCFLVLHYDKGRLGGDYYVDVRLVLLPLGLEDDRIMKRVGYMETRYKEQRDWDGIYEDLWWKHVEFR